MPYKRSSLQPIVNLLQNGETLSPTQIALFLNKSKVIIHKYLKTLLAQEEIQKIWEGSHTKYYIKGTTKINKVKKEIIPDIDYNFIEIIEKEFVKFASNGALLEGYNGFIQRCNTRDMNLKQKAEQFCKIYQHIKSIQNKCGMLEVTKIFKKNISPNFIDKLYYADQYKWMEFGRGKLAETTFYAKQSQNIWLINKSLDLIEQKLLCFIKDQKPDTIAITPHSIHRNNQLLSHLRKRLDKLNIPFIKLIKYFPHNIPIPQKSLKTRKQRIENAKETILINDPSSIKQYPKILLIDDFVGSGATLNETAQKLKNTGCKKVIGFAFVGNANLTYDVINEI